MYSRHTYHTHTHACARAHTHTHTLVLLLSTIAYLLEKYFVHICWRNISCTMIHHPRFLSNFKYMNNLSLLSLHLIVTIATENAKVWLLGLIQNITLMTVEPYIITYLDFNSTLWWYKFMRHDSLSAKNSFHSFDGIYTCLHWGIQDVEVLVCQRVWKSSMLFW